MRIGIVAGEASGDILGADLMIALKEYFPHARFEGVGGPRMLAQGFHTLFPQDRLAVMGLIEPLKRLPELFSIRKKLKEHFSLQQTDVFIGIDSPDFNLGLEQSLKATGIKTVHYVSPTVWAWRKNRIKKIKKAVDLMLALFPFEAPIYQENAIPVSVVGHPLADAIPLNSSKISARETLGLPLSTKIVAILPGSRAQELKYLGPAFVKTASWLREQDPSIEFISAAVNKERAQQLQALVQEYQAPPIKIFNHLSTQVMQASDAILVCSGTATLEAMLVKRPTVVAYKMSPFTFAIAKKIIKVPYIALANLLAGQCLMPEFIQSQVKAEEMGKKILFYLTHPQETDELLAIMEENHLLLRKNAGKTAAMEINKLIKAVP